MTVGKIQYKYLLFASIILPHSTELCTADLEVQPLCQILHGQQCHNFHSQQLQTFMLIRYDIIYNRMERAPEANSFSFAVCAPLFSEHRMVLRKTCIKEITLTLSSTTLQKREAWYPFF